MLPASELRRIAREIGEAQSGVSQVEPFTDRVSCFDLESAYAVARLIHDDRVAAGAVPVGRKIGFTNFDMWEIYGVREPIWAFVYDSTVSRLAAAAASCSLGRFTEPKIEPEVAFCFRSAPPRGADAAGMLALIAWAAPAFEIVQSHFPGWKFRAPDTVADCSLHGFLLLGEPVDLGKLGPDPRRTLESFTVDLYCNRRLRARGAGTDVLGSPLAALVHLASVLERQPEFPALQAGEIVTTGTITTAQPVRAGESWQAKFHGIALPEIALGFAD
jgi:2-oxo-3-hexenedioate decarboxylase